MVPMHEEGIRTVTYSAQGYEGRAAECVKLANLTQDQMVQSELLKLRQTYLTIAQRLRGLQPGAFMPEAPRRE